jgi:hypothetical protein
MPEMPLQMAALVVERITIAARLAVLAIHHLQVHRRATMVAALLAHLVLVVAVVEHLLPVDLVILPVLLLVPVATEQRLLSQVRL